MPAYPFDIRYGELIDVIGSPVRFQDVTFVPASTKLAGTSFSVQFNLLDWARDQNQRLPAIVHGDENAAWFLGRLMHLFNTANVAEDERMEKTCFDVSFVAVLHNASNIAVPFDCSDHYGRTSLMFSSDDEPPLELRSEIANAFFGLMLDEPDSLIDYDNRLFHSGAGFWIEFGVSQGEPYFDESADADT
ncbi:hypothetical protein SH528x_001081 [Novipirellula sp. SH528]|uniref:hypothetical protein n=1 Tax=Novipirellula sp. SH528 TaxID=3454466 RepID=UPI003F9F764F